MQKTNATCLRPRLIFPSLSQKHVYVRASFCLCVHARMCVCEQEPGLWHAYVNTMTCVFVCALKCVGLMSSIRPPRRTERLHHTCAQEASDTKGDKHEQQSICQRASEPGDPPSPFLTPTHTPLDGGRAERERVRGGGKNIRTTGFVFLRFESHAWFPAGRSVSCGTALLRRT